MSSLLNSKTVVFTVLLATVGLIFNPTRDRLSGERLYLWAATTVFVAFVLVVATQYALSRW